MVEISESVDKTLLKMLVGIPVSSRESQDVTDYDLPGQEYFWKFRIFWNLQLLIREKNPSGRSIPGQEEFNHNKISDIPGFPAGDGNHSLAFKTVYSTVIRVADKSNVSACYGALAVASKEHVLYNVHAVKNIIFIINASIAHRCFIVAVIIASRLSPLCQNGLK